VIWKVSLAPLFTETEPVGDMVPPVPADAVMIGSWAVAVKAAPTLSLPFMTTWQVWLVPEQAPDHPVKDEPALAVAVRVTDVPEANVVPLGFVATEPVPVPVSVTVSEYVTVLKLAAIVWLPVTLLNVYEVTAPTDAPSTVTELMAYPVFGVTVKVWLAP